MSELIRKLRTLEWDLSPAAYVAVDVVERLAAETEPPELERFAWNQLGGLIELERAHGPNVMTSEGMNLQFLCGRRYPERDEPLDDHDVTLQVHYSPKNGYQANVYLSNAGLPSSEARVRLLDEDHLRYFTPRKSRRQFVQNDGIASLETAWFAEEEEDAFRSAVEEAIRTFLLEDD